MVEDASQQFWSCNLLGWCVRLHKMYYYFFAPRSKDSLVIISSYIAYATKGRLYGLLKDSKSQSVFFAVIYEQTGLRLWQQTSLSIG